MICKFGTCAPKSLIWVCTRVYWYDSNKYVKCNCDHRFWILIWFKCWIWKLGTCAKKVWTYLCSCFTLPNYWSHIFIHNSVSSSYSGEIFYNLKPEPIIRLFLKHNPWPIESCIQNRPWTFRSGGLNCLGHWTALAMIENGRRTVWA